MTSDIISALDALTVTLSAAFGSRSGKNFSLLVRGLLLCLGRPTVTNLARAAGEPRPERPSRLHRFFSRASWSVEELSRLLLVEVIVPRLAPEGDIVLAGDDTTAAKSGRKVAFAGRFRDAVASAGGRAVSHWSHNWVVLCLIAPCPFAPDRLLHLPVMARLYRREADCDAAHPFRTRSQMIAEMVASVSGWLPGRRLLLAVDGAYPSAELFAGLPSQVVLVTRMRRNAALYEPAPARRPGQRGRTRQRGERLPKVEALSDGVRFRKATVLQYGRRRVRLLASRVVLWYAVSKRPVLLVIVRDPSGRERDDYFVATDVGMSAERVAEVYAARWGVEEAIREGKQSLGFDQVQSWSGKAVERQAAFVLVVQAMVQVAHLDSAGADGGVATMPSFGRVLTRVRFEVWRCRISSAFGSEKSSTNILELLENTLLTAARLAKVHLPVFLAKSLKRREWFARRAASCRPLARARVPLSPSPLAHASGFMLPPTAWAVLATP